MTMLATVIHWLPTAGNVICAIFAWKIAALHRKALREIAISDGQWAKWEARADDRLEYMITARDLARMGATAETVGNYLEGMIRATRVGKRDLYDAAGHASFH